MAPLLIAFKAGNNYDHLEDSICFNFILFLFDTHNKAIHSPQITKIIIREQNKEGKTRELLISDYTENSGFT